MSEELPPLHADEELMTDGDENIFRQVTEVNWDDVNGKPGNLAFGPANIDKGKCSHSRESKTTAQESRNWHQENAAKKSMGVWRLTVRDVDNVELRTVDDSAVPRREGQPLPAPGHCYVDFRHLTKSQERNTRAVLLRRALALGEVETVDV